MPLLLAVIGALGIAATPAQALPTDQQLYFDDFESGTLSGWSVKTAANGVAEVQNGLSYNGSKAAHLNVPDYGAGSLANIRRILHAPVYALSAVGRFKAVTTGCADDGTYSNGNLPFLRFFDTSGKRVAGLYRINAESCTTNAKLYVQHSGNYYRTGKNIKVGEWSKLELRIVVGTPSASLVQVYVDDSLVYESTIADNGTLPLASVTVHNEHPDQKGELLADDIRIATFDVSQPPPPTDPCAPATPAPTTTDPGTTILADNFESFSFSNWSTVTRSGDAVASIQSTRVHSGICAAFLSVTSNASSKANLIMNLAAGTSEVWASGWFNVVSAPSTTGSNVPEFRMFNGTSRIVDVYRVNGNGQMYLRLPNGSGGYVYSSLGRIHALDTWHQIKVHAIANGSAGTVEVWLDGTRMYGNAAAALGVTSLSSVMIGAEHFAQEGQIAADDVVIKVLP